MDDNGNEPGPRCWWCGEPLDGPSRRRYCPRPRLCRDKAYRDRRKAKQAGPERVALAHTGHLVDEQLQATREVLLAAVYQGEAWPGVFALAAAVLEKRTQDLVRVCVLEERAIGATWEQIGEPFEISADAARKRWSRFELAHREEFEFPADGPEDGGTPGRSD
ncbi:hypothetical protein [Streptomyces sp. NPDC013489]|uniref:hypothetical protein n=1 Tax=Streptomyces sp. NPDC013489 TaxID=3155606 RepID=UPI0033F4D1CE